MAACGLASSRRNIREGSGSSTSDVTEIDDPLNFLATLVHFAAAMGASLKRLNRKHLYNFQLRMG